LIFCFSCDFKNDVAQGDDIIFKIKSLKDNFRKEHPRLILLDEALDELKETHKTDVILQQYVTDVIHKAEKLKTAPNLEFKKGKLKKESQECIDRIYTLGLAWRWTQNEDYLKLAKQNLNTVCAFESWGADFLNKAEMAHAVGIGYDWLYEMLSESEKKFLQSAITEKALLPAVNAFADMHEVETIEGFVEQEEDSIGMWANRLFPKSQAILRVHGKQWWPGCDHNWNVVCNGGILIGAIAIANEQPQFLDKLLPDILKTLPRALRNYAPDGVWGEGIFLWDYTTSYAAYTINALLTAFGNDAGLSQFAGLDKTGSFMIRSIGPSGRFFNFADNPSDLTVAEYPVLFWLGKAYSDPSISNWEHHNLINRQAGPLHVIWYHPENTQAGPPKVRDVCMGGPVEMVYLDKRSTNGISTFIKGGYNQFNHNHLDLGNFIIESDELRWITDLNVLHMGKDNFRLPEYWDGSPEGLRWSYFSTSTNGHNTFSLDDQNQDAYAKAYFSEINLENEHPFVILDLTDAYDSKSIKTKRGYMISNCRKLFLVQDEITLTMPAEIKWNLITEAEVEQIKEGEFELIQSGQTLGVSTLLNEKFDFTIEKVKPVPPEVLSDRAKRISFTFMGKKGMNMIAVRFQFGTPEAIPEQSKDIIALKEW
jgi:hypothetical protein